MVSMRECEGLSVASLQLLFYTAQKVFKYFLLYLFSFFPQLFNLSEKRYDISKLHPKVSILNLFLCIFRQLMCAMGVHFSALIFFCSCSCVCFRCWILAGLIIMLQLWIRSAAYVKPWTHGWVLTAIMLWFCTTR